MPASDQQPDSAPRRALRRSCDRCHAQKLKCLGTSDAIHGPCQRCQQAGLSCVYSQRSARRTNPRRSDTTSSATNTTGRSSTNPARPPSLHLSPTSNFQFWPETRNQTQNSEDLLLCDVSSSSSPGPFGFFDETLGLDPLSSPQNQDQTQLPSWLSPFPSTDPTAGFPLDFLNFSTTATGAATTTNGFVATDEASETDCRDEQVTLSKSLDQASQSLEEILHEITTEWSRRNVWKYPIGRFLQAKSTLATVLKGHTNTATARGQSVRCLQMRNVLSATHCYLLSVTITATLSTLLLNQLSDRTSMVGGETGQTSNGRPGSQSSRFSFTGSDGDTDMASLHSGIHISEVTSFLNPYRHAVSSACATLSASLRLLRDVEIALGISQEQGVLGVVRSSEGFGNSTVAVHGRDCMLAAAAEIMPALLRASGEPFTVLKRSFARIQELMQR